MDELKRAIQQAGGVSALARSLGISQSRVSNWITRESIPDGWLQVIRMRAQSAAEAVDTSAAGQGVTNA